MAVRKLMPALNSSGIFLEGHFCQQEPQPVHFAKSTLLAFSRIFTSKFPIKPVTFSTSANVCNVMFGCCATSTMRGVRMHCEQSSVGKVSESCDMCPPMEGVFSTMMT